MLENDKFATWANENILVIVGHTEADHPVEEVTGENGEKVRKCGLYPGLTCDQHEAAARECHNPPSGLPAIEQKNGVPNSWFVLPNGEVREIPPADQQVAKNIMDLADEIYADIGKPLTLSKWEKYNEELAEAAAAVEEGKLKDALKLYVKLEKDARKMPDAMVARVTAAIDALNEAALAALAEIRDGSDDDATKLKAARDLLAEVRQRMKDGYLPAKEEIEAYVAELKAAG